MSCIHVCWPQYGGLNESHQKKGKLKTMQVELNLVLVKVGSVVKLDGKVVSFRKEDSLRTKEQLNGMKAKLHDLVKLSSKEDGLHNEEKLEGVKVWTCHGEKLKRPKV